MSRIINKLECVNPWHFFWVTVILSQIFTAVLNAIQSYLRWGFISPELLAIGAIDALFVPVVVAPIIMIFVMRTSKLREDLSRHQEFEEAIRESQKRYQTLTDESSDAIFILDTEGNFLEVNKRAEQLTGYAREELLNLHFAKLHSDEVIRDVVACFEKGLQTGSSSYVELPLVRKDGRTIHVDLVGKFIECSGRKLGQAIVRDITERKRAEEALRESEGRFRRLFQNMLEGLAYCKILFDEEGNPTDWLYLDINSAFSSLTGLKNIVGKRATEIFPGIKESYPELLEIYGRVALTGRPEKLELNCKPLAIWLNVSVFSPAREHFVAVFDNITMQKKAEERVLTYQRKLRSLTSQFSLIEERERRSIASDLHDTVGQRLALSKIKLGAMREAASSPELIGAIDEIRQNIEQAIRYTRSLTSELSPSVLYELGLEAAVESLAEQFQERHGISFNIDMDKTPRPLDEDVRTFLFKAVRELLVNIVKHAKARRVDISITRADDRMQILVRDDGVGFESSDLKLHSEKGFGLFNIRERLESIGGLFEIASQPGQGSRASIVAPLRTEGRG